LGKAVLELEQTLAQSIWLLFNHPTQAEFDDSLRAQFFAARNSLAANCPIAVLIDSPGGQAKTAYQIAHMLKTHCGGFTAIVPRYAKSAATLFALGADEILISRYGELGPLDVQMLDPDREAYVSALDEVQALERLQAFAMDVVDKTMMLLISRTAKRTDIILPIVLRFVAELVRPLFEKIDVVHYNSSSRLLKVAEEYAVRLLQPRLTEDQAKAIARHLVEKYPEHGFFIDGEEASKIEGVGLPTITYPTDDQVRIMDVMMPYLGKTTAIGKVTEVPRP